YVDDMESKGLEGVVAAATRLSHVDGERGELIIAGYLLDDVAEHATFEEMTWLMWHGELPTVAELDDFRAALASVRDIPDTAVLLLRQSQSGRDGCAAHGRRCALTRHWR